MSMHPNFDRWQKAVNEIHDMTCHMGRMMAKRLPPVHEKGAQHGLDDHLRKLLPPEHGGTYVDVGASHPVECSNTWMYYSFGWRGLLVEPLPECWYSLLRKRGGDVLEPIAAASYNGMNFLRVHGTVSSFSPDWNIQEWANIVVETEKLSTILERHPQIRDNCKLCSIDTEGTEADVLDGIDFNTFRPNVFVIEYRVYNPDSWLEGVDQSAELLKRLEPHGYRENHRTELNVVYTR